MWQTKAAHPDGSCSSRTEGVARIAVVLSSGLKASSFSGFLHLIRPKDIVAQHLPTNSNKDTKQFQSIELGNFTEAAEELHNLPPALKSSVEFCRLWIRVYSATNHWPEVEVMCETLLKHAPDDHFAIRHQAEAFHKQGRSREAFSAYQYAPVEFKQGAVYFYALARYLCALDQERLASTCISNAIDWDPSLKMKALNDPDLEKVWLNLHDD